jgi:hypothetical protein
VEVNSDNHFQEAFEAFSERRIPEALELLDRAERAGYGRSQCGAYRWYCWMLSGNFEAAWQESDRIAADGHPDASRLWDGKPFAKKRVLIRCLHGYGDAIQFLRYASLIRETATRVIVQCHREMVTLLRGVKSVDQVISWQEAAWESPEEWDQQIEVMELPRAFRTTLESVPGRVPYLSIDAPWRSRSLVRNDGPKPRVALQWGSSTWNPARSLPLLAFLPVLSCPGLDFYTLQRGDQAAELATLPSDRPILDVSGDEIAAAAANLLNIDLLITVDTMLAHLAGALAKPVWLLLPFEADWRWMINRDDSPWYPTMKIFRQTSPGDWESPIRQVVAELQRLFAR